MDVHAVESASPLALGPGVVELREIHPTDDERWIHAELVEARPTMGIRAGSSADAESLPRPTAGSRRRSR